MEQKNKKSELVYACIPLYLLPKGESGWIDITSYDDLIITHNSPPSLKELQLTRYIKKDAYYFTADIGGCAKITRIGNGLTGNDFEVSFLGEEGILGCYTADPKGLELDKYLPGPVPVSLPVGPTVAEQQANQANWDINNLLMDMLDYVNPNNTKFKAVESKAYELLTQFKEVGAKHYFDVYDDAEELAGFIQGYTERLDECKASPTCARNRFAIKLYQTLIDVMQGAISLHAEHLHKLAKTEKSLDDMSPKDLNNLLKLHIDNEDFEKATNVRNTMSKRGISIDT